ncbi:MAG: M23 family metallopeptidase [Clostridiales bacterium]|nr:M23 family metallopeptidase [Clostridiales bacterium]
MSNDNKGKKMRKKIAHFLERQGFYVVLFICICVIGITALLTTMDRDKVDKNNAENEFGEYIDQDPLPEYDMYMQGLYTDTDSDIGIAASIEDDEKEADEDNKADNKEDNGKSNKDGSEGDKIEKIDIKIEDILMDEDAENEDIKEAGEDKKSLGEAQPVVNPQKEETISSKGGHLVMLSPVKSNAIICDYAKDELVYSSTLKEWRTHPGIDIESPLGSEVRAAADGKVQAIEEDALMGIIIVLEHGGGIITKYANLSTKEMVEVGQTVKEGQVISGVGRTATAEILDAPHLHFEVLIDGEHVDPKMFFK